MVAPSSEVGLGASLTGIALVPTESPAGCVSLLQHLRRLLVLPEPLNLPAHSIRSYLRKIHSDVHQSCTYGDGAPLATVNIAVAVFCTVDTTSEL